MHGWQEPPFPFSLDAEFMKASLILEIPRSRDEALNLGLVGDAAVPRQCSCLGFQFGPVRVSLELQRSDIEYFTLKVGALDPL